MVRTMTQMTGKAGGFALAAMLFTAACSDAGTRVAHDIESAAKTLGSIEGSRISIRHVPRSRPEGCAGSYTLTIGAGRALGDGHGNFRIVEGARGLSVHCVDPPAGGGSTTYHLRFVDVPATLQVSKSAGEAAIIDLQRVSGRAVVVGLH
jgi:hypothetical protein